MYIKLHLAICQARPWQPLGLGDRFQSGMRHQSLSRCDWLFVCATAAPPSERGEARPGWLLPLPLYIHWSCLTPCYTPAAECGNAYLHSAGPSLSHAQCHLGVLAPAWAGGRSSPSLIASALVRRFRRGVGGVGGGCLFRRPCCSGDSWLTSGLSVPLCLSDFWHIRGKSFRSPSALKLRHNGFGARQKRQRVKRQRAPTFLTSNAN